MRIHYFQHIAGEDPGSIAAWARAGGHTLTATRFYRDDPLPRFEDLDWLLIMGGPMNIYEEETYPWLSREKRFIEEAIGKGKTVIGVCLGSQLIADVLGAKVFRNREKEIGWFPINLTPEAEKSRIFGFLPSPFNVFHWHGDTFDLPRGATRIAYSEGCRNQAFVYGEKTIGLQFHLEFTREIVQELIGSCAGELVEGKYIQRANEMLSPALDFKRNNEALNTILDNILVTASRASGK